MSSADDESDRYEGTPHPRTTYRLVGHREAERELLDAYRYNRLPQAIILGGPEGIGKATLAWRLARFILAHPEFASADTQSAEALSVPPSSKAAHEIASLSHPDLVLLRRETNEKTKRFFTEIRADDVRRAIGLFQRAAGAGGYRICIIDSAEHLNRSSANALLKLIEEPPPKSLFLFVAHRPGLVMPTIRSRAHLVRLKPLAAFEICEVLDGLKNGLDAKETELASASARAQGSMHGALRHLRGQGDAVGEIVERLLGRLPAVDWTDVHRLADRVSGRDGEAAFATVEADIFDWLAERVRTDPAQTVDRLAPYAEVWEKAAASAREAEALNLDKRPLILSLFSELAVAVHASAA